MNKKSELFLKKDVHKPIPYTEIGLHLKTNHGTGSHLFTVTGHSRRKSLQLFTVHLYVKR